MRKVLMGVQYWIIMIHLYHEFVRSIRVGDSELYTYYFPRIGNIIFAFNHPYARWIVRYHDNLLKLKEIHLTSMKSLKKDDFPYKEPVAERLRYRSREQKVPSSSPRLDISVEVTSQC